MSDTDPVVVVSPVATPVVTAEPKDMPNCPSCRYPRAGLESRTCPECGYETTEFDIANHMRRQLFMELTCWPAYGWLTAHVVWAVVLGVWPLVPLAIVIALGWWMFRQHGYERRRLSRRVWLMITPWVQVCWVLPQTAAWIIDMVYWNTSWLDTLYYMVEDVLEPNYLLVLSGGGIVTGGCGVSIAMWRWRRLTRLAGLSDGGPILSPLQRRVIHFALLIPCMLITATVLTTLLCMVLDRFMPGWDG